VQLAVYYDELEMSARQDEPNQSLLLSAREIEVEPSSLEADSSGSNRRTRRARLADTLVGPFAPPKEIKMVLLAGVKGICGAGAVKCSRPSPKSMNAMQPRITAPTTGGLMQFPNRRLQSDGAVNILISWASNRNPCVAIASGPENNRWCR
jgi:hypothetical protein